MEVEKESVLTHTTIDIVDHYWVSDLGCAREALYTKQTLVVPHHFGDYQGIYAFCRQDLLLVSVPASLVEAFRCEARSWRPRDVLQEDRLRRLVSHPVERMIGPAFVGYTDGAAFQPVQQGAPRLLTPQDVPALEALRAACSALEWEHEGSSFGEQPLVGIHVEGGLAAVAGYEWGEAIAHISVITHPRHRGQGYGKAVVSQLTEEVLSQGLVPQYQTLESNVSSMAIAHNLGFEHYATTMAVKLILILLNWSAFSESRQQRSRCRHGR